jgi:hypothetical protein
VVETSCWFESGQGHQSLRGTFSGSIEVRFGRMKESEFLDRLAALSVIGKDVKRNLLTVLIAVTAAATRIQ